MATYGYARVSTTEQDTAIQEEALRRAGCEIIRKERSSGTSRVTRSELQTLLEFLRSGDTLVVTRIDRLARSIADLQDIVRLLKDKGAALKATEQPINTGTAAGKAFLAEAHAAGAQFVASGCVMRAMVAELSRTAAADCGCAGENQNS